MPRLGHHCLLGCCCQVVADLVVAGHFEVELVVALLEVAVELVAGLVADLVVVGQLEVELVAGLLEVADEFVADLVADLVVELGSDLVVGLVVRLAAVIVVAEAGLVDFHSPEDQHFVLQTLQKSNLVYLGQGYIQKLSREPGSKEKLIIVNFSQSLVRNLQDYSYLLAP